MAEGNLKDFQVEGEKELLEFVGRGNKCGKWVTGLSHCQTDLRPVKLHFAVLLPFQHIIVEILVNAIQFIESF